MNNVNINSEGYQLGYATGYSAGYDAAWKTKQEIVDVLLTKQLAVGTVRVDKLELDDPYTFDASRLRKIAEIMDVPCDDA